MNIVEELNDYMFTTRNISRYNKHMFNNKKNEVKTINRKIIDKKPELKKDLYYSPKQKDSLFWCFYIIKNGFSNYEMEINGQYFTVEKNEKYKYIEKIRKNKDKLKLHKIKPYTEIEDDLANKERISVKTFFALCLMENINIILINKRKIYELLCVDPDTKNPINIVHRNSETYEHSIEIEASQEIITKYRDTYYKMTSFDSTLKSMTSYKLEELIELCNKLNIDLKSNKNDNKKMTKKDIYELLVMNY